MYTKQFSRKVECVQVVKTHLSWLNKCYEIVHKSYIHALFFIIDLVHLLSPQTTSSLSLQVSISYISHNAVRQPKLIHAMPRSHRTDGGWK